MKIVKKLKKAGAFLSLLRSISFRSFYFFLKRSNEGVPDVVTKTSEFGTFSGFENDYIFNSAITQGSNEQHFQEIVEHLISKDTVILDVGANIGTHSILFSQKAHLGKVFAFEAQSLVFSILQNNLILNDCDNVIAYRFAVSDVDTNVMSMDPFSFSGEKINNGALRVDKKGNDIGDLVLTRKLDSFKFPPIDFIKMDIQGSEVDALTGAEGLIAKDRPVMFIEIEEQHLRALGNSAKVLIEKILSYDYVLYRLETHYPCDHLCIPSEKSDVFERDMKEKFRCPMTKIKGKKVHLEFASERSQNYQSIRIVE